MEWYLMFCEANGDMLGVFGPFKTEHDAWEWGYDNTRNGLKFKPVRITPPDRKP